MLPRPSGLWPVRRLLLVGIAVALILALLYVLVALAPRRKRRRVALSGLLIWFSCCAFPGGALPCHFTPT